MSAKKFKFVSPGVFLNEIDNSILPREPREIGPLIIGRAERGPANRPVTVDSFEEFVNLYGTPVPGGNGDDVWRNGNKLTPMYGTYAAQAWLKNSSTLTYFRLGGVAHLNNDGSADAKAGWKTDFLLLRNEDSADWAANSIGAVATGSATGSAAAGGGAFGLFVFDDKISGSAGVPVQTTGSLAAIWYVNEGSVGLRGLTAAYSGSDISKPFAQAELIASDSAGNFTAVITGSSGLKEEIKFNFDKNNNKFIRKVFNTNPTLVNTTTTTTNAAKNYWLGETFETTVTNFPSEAISTNATHNVPTTRDNTYYGAILYIGSAAPDVNGNHHANRQRDFTDPETGWYFSQDLGSATGSFDPRNMQKLFKFVSLGHGEWAQKNIKISIQNIKEPTNNFDKYPKFNVVVRNIADNDQAQVILEKFDNCNLNPKSPDFIGSKIGTQYFQFNTAKRRLELRGTFPNKSRYIYVSLDATVEGGSANEEFVPFGVYGPVKYRDIHARPKFGVDMASQSTGSYFLHTVLTSSAQGEDYRGVIQEIVTSSTQQMNMVFAVGGGINYSEVQAQFAGARARTGPTYKFLENFATPSYITSSVGNLSYKLAFPRAQLRQHTDQDGLSSPSQANFGAWTGESLTSTVFNREILDLVRAPTSDISEIHDPSTTSQLEHQYVFTLDDIYYDSTNKRYAYERGTRRGTNSAPPLGTSVTAVSGSWRDLIATGVTSFTTLLYGGTEGFNVTEKDPLRNTFTDGATETANYAYNTIKQGIDSVKDPEFAEYNLIAIPGITNEGLTRHLVDTVEDRADALAVIDLKGDFAPIHEAQAASYGSVTTAVSNVKNRQINSSYACAYYPYVTVRDTLTGDLVYMPPSVLAIGAMSFTDRTKAPWFAPAGFNRGGLSSGVAGLPVISVTDKLNSEDRDKLYEANINPIASFPSEGIVIFGQKTLQLTQSALDRINVRRLLLFVKKGISRISNELLFEPNVQETWDRFISRANPFLADVKARFGLTDYKLVLDKTTTTPDLIDQNILYAKVFLKPARAIEFIAVDFIITNTGASFED